MAKPMITRTNWATSPWEQEQPGLQANDTKVQTKDTKNNHGYIPVTWTTMTRKDNHGYIPKYQWQS